MNMWKQIKNIMALAIIKKMKVLSADIVKYIQDLYAYNNKMLMEKIKHLNRDELCSWIGRLNIVNIPILCKLIFVLKSWVFFGKREILSIFMEKQRNKNS